MRENENVFRMANFLLSESRIAADKWIARIEDIHNFSVEVRDAFGESMRENENVFRMANFLLSESRITAD